MLKIIFFGDICGQPGRKVVKKMLPEIVAKEQPDLLLANVENLAHGKGVTPKTLEELINAGFHGFTSGNHIFSKRDMSVEVFTKYGDRVVRPANFPDGFPGKSAVVLKTKKGDVLIGNFMGNVFMEKQFRDPVASPFSVFDKWYLDHKGDYAATLIDFHAEATSEKIAFGYYIEGKVSVMLGTHTHVPTADYKILPSGTAYMTDVGMCGADDSVLGVKKEISIERFTSGQYLPFDIPEDASAAQLSYVIIEVDEKTAKATAIRGVHQVIEI